MKKQLKMMIIEILLLCTLGTLLFPVRSYGTMFLMEMLVGVFGTTNGILISISIMEEKEKEEEKEEEEEE